MREVDSNWLEAVDGLLLEVRFDKPFYNKAYAVSCNVLGSFDVEAMSTSFLIARNSSFSNCR